MQNLDDFLFFCDLETTGGCPIKNGICEFALVVTDRQLNVVDEFYRRVCPPDFSPQNWSIEAAEKHKFTVNEVRKHMPNEQFCYELLCFLAKYKRPDNKPFPFVCHASPGGWVIKTKTGTIIEIKIYPWFDWHFLDWAMRKAKFADGRTMNFSLYKIFSFSKLISTVQMGRDLGYKSNNLKAWAKRVGFKLDHHAAMSDTHACKEIFKYQYPRLTHTNNNDGDVLNGFRA